LGSTTFILVGFPSEVVCKIWISNFRNSNVVFHDKMISNQKLSTIEFYNFPKSTTFILIIYLCDIVVVTLVTLFTNVTYLSYSFNNVTTTLSNEEIIKIKIVDLDKLYNFYVHDLFSWNLLVFQNNVWSCYFLKFKIQIDKTQSHKKMDKIIVVRTQ